MTSLLLLKQLRLAQNPVANKNNSSVSHTSPLGSKVFEKISMFAFALQLKAMLDEAIQGRSSGSSRKPSASGVAAPHPPPQPVSSNPRDEQRRNFENLKRDLNDLMDVPGASASTKRPKLHGSPGFSKLFL